MSDTTPPETQEGGLEPIVERHYCRQCPVPIPESLGGTKEANEAAYDRHIAQLNQSDKE